MRWPQQATATSSRSQPTAAMACQPRPWHRQWPATAASQPWPQPTTATSQSRPQPTATTDDHNLPTLTAGRPRQTTATTSLRSPAASAVAIAVSLRSSAPTTTAATSPSPGRGPPTHRCVLLSCRHRIWLRHHRIWGLLPHRRGGAPASVRCLRGAKAVAPTQSYQRLEGWPHYHLHHGPHELSAARLGGGAPEAVAAPWVAVARVARTGRWDGACFSFLAPRLFIRRFLVETGKTLLVLMLTKFDADIHQANNDIELK